MLKVNLHTHTIGSFDSITTDKDLQKVFDSGTLDQIAITDHDEIDYAKKMQDKFGEKVIVGQEITLDDGKHIISLFSDKFIPRGLTLLRTAELIKNQNGIVYVPHPYEIENGIGLEGLKMLLDYQLLDIVESFNGWNKFLLICISRRKVHNELALEFALKHSLPHVSASDAHTPSALYNAHTKVSNYLSRKNILDLLKSDRVEYNNVYNKARYQDAIAYLRTFRLFKRRN